MSVLEEKSYQVTVEEFYQMYESGMFAEDDRVELIEGEIIHMTPIGSWHSAVVDRLNELFVERFSAYAIVRIQGAVLLSRKSEPLPDVVVMKRKEDFYASGHPQPEDMFLIVEVSDTTIRYDRSIKVPLYARSGISEVWIVNLQEDWIEAYRKPLFSDYQEKIVYRRGQRIAPEFYADAVFLVDDILG
ncbi:MAG TPA: Uma2 family endonuclease [Thermodesulfovibrionia bacterium]|nr:Uma2 family endonuclease [Thermodesulfovibrionia bacterium]